MSITASHVTSLSLSIVGTGVPHDRRDLRAAIALIETLVANCLDIRHSGCPTLDICWVACGRLAAHTEKLRPWDIAAATLIATEAGAIRIDQPNGSAWPHDLDGERYAISAPGVSRAMADLIQSVEEKHP